MRVDVYTNEIKVAASYGKGHKLVVDEGHLKVYDEGTKAIAVYSPGSWHHAEVTDKAA
jgi:hypothetical protein